MPKGSEFQYLRILFNISIWNLGMPRTSFQMICRKMLMDGSSKAEQ